ncbi:MAG: carboxylate--amine ligase [Candidatus Thorarchaeota archaeon]|jgi:predicted ATP-grasp superfamily ATP-dependent carboligase
MPDHKVLIDEKFDTSVPCVIICPGYHGHGAARSLGRLGIDVYGVHTFHNSPTAASRYWRENFFWDLSKHSNQESVNWFKDLASKLGSRPILIPTDDESCIFVNDNSKVLLENYLFPNQPDGLSLTLVNKKKLYSLCNEKSILTPMTVFPKSREEVVEFIKDASLPVMLKGIDTVKLQKRVGVRMVIVKEAETLLKLYDEMESTEDPSLMIQEYISGGAENVWMFDGYFDDDSNCLFGITGKKLRQYPAYTGMTSLGVCEKNEEVIEIIKKFMKSINYRGILDIGYKLDSISGKYYLLDPNPRLGATFRLFVDSNGMDVVRVLYRHMTGQSVTTGEMHNGRRWISEPFDIVSSIRYWRDNNLSFGDWIHSFKGLEEAQWFARDDMKPFLKVWPKSFKRALL